jgi:tRNA threonylcarbamoyladenosine biosynthesis protein TsaE
MSPTGSRLGSSRISLGSTSDWIQPGHFHPVALPDPPVTATKSARETEAVGERIASGLRPGDVVLVSGELGAGKTTLIRGACRALGVTDPITSPTFVIGQRYSGRVPVSHLDLYRLADLGREDPALLEDYLTPDAVAFVEWPAAAEPTLERVDRRVEIRHAGGDRREVLIDR